MISMILIIISKFINQVKILTIYLILL